MMNSTFDTVVAILRDKCELDESIPITMETTFQDLDLDSLSVVEIALDCETEFGIELEIDPENPPKVMGEFIALIDALLC